MKFSKSISSEQSQVCPALQAINLYTSMNLQTAQKAKAMTFQNLTQIVGSSYSPVHGSQDLTS